MPLNNNDFFDYMDYESVDKKEFKLRFNHSNLSFFNADVRAHFKDWRMMKRFGLRASSCPSCSETLLRAACGDGAKISQIDLLRASQLASED